MTRVITIALSLVVLSLFAPQFAQATEVGNARSFGLGFQVGDPTALVGKAFIGRGNAIDFGIGFNGWGYGRCRDGNGNYYNCGGRGHRDLSLHADYLWQEPLVRDQVKLDWHIGVGGRVMFWNAWDGGDDYVALMARMPLGLDLTFQRPDFLEVYFEIAPALVVVPALWLDVDAALGVRFYF